MLKERFLCRGKQTISHGRRIPESEREWVVGWYSPYYENDEHDPDNESAYIIRAREAGGMGVDFVPVDPATVELVTAPVTRKKMPAPGGGSEYRCPSCGVWFVGVNRVGDKFYGSTPYCGNCGQRLDWSAALDDPNEGCEQ